MHSSESPNDSVHDYHAHVPPKNWSRFKGVDFGDPYKYSEAIVNSAIFQPLWNKWQANASEPFYGITNNGSKIEGLYHLRDEGAPTKEMVLAGNNFIESLSAKEKETSLHQIDSENWRKWSNPEIILFQPGIRLENLQQRKVDLIWKIVAESLSQLGYKKVREAVKTNKFLGQICSREAILNERSYFFSVFGIPSTTTPWGYMLFGHHLCLNVCVVRGQIVIGPVFLGAEPCIIDSGPDKGTRLCSLEEELGLHLMQSLPPNLQRRAQTYSKMHDPSMPEGRWNPADQRHMAGAFQDNRVIPYEGVRVLDMPLELHQVFFDIVGAFLILLPPKALEYRISEIREHISETFFSWIGGYGPTDPFYYRIQSPVALLEFDHHSGVFLTNEEPKKYHIHTIQRLPNGNDYGKELRMLVGENKANQYQ